VEVEGYDLVMIGILAVAGLLGYFRGIVWQVASILGIVASGFVALRFGAQVAPWFGQTAPWNQLSGMLALYAATSAGVWIVFRLVSKAISAVHLSAFDHQLGLLLGLAKGALLCIVITFFAVTLAPGYRDQIVASRSGRLVAEVIVRADEFLPPEVAATVDPFVKQFEEQFRDGPGGAAQPTARATGAPSPLEAMWDGVRSAAAWTGAEQGGQGGGAMAQQAGGALPAGSSWFVPPQSAPPPAQQARPAASAFSAPPGPFPVGSQSPLPVR